MKTRSSLVSNSSASSFIIAGKNLDKALFWRHTLDEIVEIEYVLSTEKELIDCFKEYKEWFGLEEDDKKDNYKTALDCIKNGKTVYVSLCCDSGYGMDGPPMMRGLVDGGWDEADIPPEFEYEVIKDCDGY